MAIMKHDMKAILGPSSTRRALRRAVWWPKGTTRMNLTYRCPLLW